MTAKTSDGKKSNVLTYNDLGKRIATNLSKLKDAMGWTQKEFAEKLGVSTGALNNYINAESVDLRVPSLDVLLRLCQIPDFAENGLQFGVDDLLSESFNPEEVIKWHKSVITGERITVIHSDYVGNYFCYLNDQANLSEGLGDKKVRDLRFGVFSIFDRVDSVSGKRIMQVYARFFKSENRNKAEELKLRLEHIFGNSSLKDDITPKSNGDRNKEIDEYVAKDSKFYSGELTFNGQHGFIHLSSETFSDKALIIFRLPEKNASNEFIGGIGSMTSVSHGSEHIPVSQKIILSRYKLNRDDQYIADHLNMTFPNFTRDGSAKKISEFCSKLYNNSIEGLDESDKIAVIQARLHKVIVDFIKNNLTCVSGVSKDENTRVYRLIQDSKPY